MQAALSKVEGVVSSEVTKGRAVVTAKKDVETKHMIKALKKAGFGGSVEKKEKKG